MLLLLATAVLGLANVLAWWRVGGDVRGWVLVAFLLCCLSMLAAWSVWRDMFSGQLLWNGRAWLVRADGPCGAWKAQEALLRPSVHLDVSAGLLLSVRFGSALPGRGTLWLWLEPGQAPQRWFALRRALYARGGA